MTQEFENFSITDNWGTRAVFGNLGELRDFVTRERKAWSWISDASHEVIDLAAQYLGAFDVIESWLTEFENARMDEATLRNNVNSVYSAPSSQLVFSTCEKGTSVQTLANALGPDSGEIGLALLTRRLSLDVQNPDHFRIWQLLTEPSLLGPSAWLAAEKRRLQAIRDRLKDSVRDHDKAAAAQLKNLSGLAESQRSSYRAFGWKAIREAIRRIQIIQRIADERIAEIKSVTAAYDEKMNLMAPVKYWRGKSRTHAKAARLWGIALAFYTISSIIVASILFNKVWNSLGDNEQLSGKHFLLVAAIGSTLTLMFWFARLIVRIFLGERHLHTDADERRVMTQAYLALIRAKGASDNERLVILTALFRSASDGIIADDGATDISLPSMVARILEQKTR